MPAPDSDGWYTRRDGIVRGPFAAATVTRYILLGRIGLDDEISRDRVDWSTVTERTGLLPDALAGIDSWEDYQQLVLARLAVDERRGQRRDPSHTHAATERRSGHERRQVDAIHRLARDLLGRERPAADRFLPARPVMVAVLLVVVAALVVLVPGSG